MLVCLLRLPGLMMILFRGEIRTDECAKIYFVDEGLAITSLRVCTEHRTATQRYEAIPFVNTYTNNI